MAGMKASALRWKSAIFVRPESPSNMSGAFKERPRLTQAKIAQNLIRSFIILGVHLAVLHRACRRQMMVYFADEEQKKTLMFLSSAAKAVKAVDALAQELKASRDAMAMAAKSLDFAGKVLAERDAEIKRLKAIIARMEVQGHG
jgi:hypothetical protein